MTNWKDDLVQLLTETDPNPVDDLTGSAVGQWVGRGVSSDPANYLFKTLDAPASVVRGGIGSLVNVGQGEGLSGVGLEPGQREWDESWQGFRQADLGPAGILKTPVEVAANVAIDPTTWTGFGVAGRLAKGAGVAADAATVAGQPVRSGALRTAAMGLQGAQAINDAPTKILLEGIPLPRAIPKIGGKTTPGIQAAFRQAGRGIEKVRPGLLATSKASEIRAVEDVLMGADAERASATLHPQDTPDPPPIQAPLFHGSPTRKLATLSSELPLAERGRPNAASTMGVFMSPSEDIATGYSMIGRTLDADGKPLLGQVYRADNELSNPLLMEQHDFYSRFVRTGDEAMADAAAFKAEAIANGHDGIVIFRDDAQLDDGTRTLDSLKFEDIKEVVTFRDVEVRPVHWDHRLSNEVNELYDTPVPRLPGKEDPAKTYGQFLDEAEALRQADIDTVKASGHTWRPGLKLSEIEKIVADDPQVTKIVKTWAKDHKGDPLHVEDARVVARSDLIDRLEAAEGITHTRSTVPALLVGAWKTVALATPRFVAANLLGNMMMQSVRGIRPTFGWDEYAAAFTAARRGRIMVTADEALESSSITQWARENGDAYAPQEMFRGGSRAFAGTDRYAQNPLGELVGRVTRSQKLANLATHMVEPFEQAALAVDTVARGGTWKQASRDALAKTKPDFDARVAAKLAEVGVTDEVFSTVKKIGLPEEGMFAQPLKQRFIELGLSDGNADHLTRVWRGMWNDAKKAGMIETNKIMFDYARTNLDEMVGKVVPFHYWPSRALRFWGEESIQNPAIPLNYMRMTDGIEDAERNPGMSARQKGFLRVMGTSLGFSLLMNPDALFGFAKVMNLDSAFNEPETAIDPLTGEVVAKQDSFTPQGETELGHAMRVLREKGIGLYPWLDAAFNVMGTYGNTFEPDFLPIRHKALVGAALNEVRAHTGMEPIGTPYADAMGHLRQGVSTAVSAFMPNGLEQWLAEPVMARAGGSSQDANIDTIIEHEILAHNPGMTNEQMLAVMSDPNSEEYERAYQVVSDAGLINELLSVTVPWSVKLRHDGRDVTRAQVEVMSEEADRKGVLPWELAPTKDDLEFHAKYKRLTGKDYQPGDWESAKLRHDITRAPLEAKPLLLAEAEYTALGTPKQQGHWDAYWALLVGDDPAVAGMSDAGRQVLAGQYLDAHPGAQRAIDAIRAQREAFTSSHPEFAEFRAWQERMDDLNTQLGGTLTEYRRQASLQNPNAARYFAEQQEYIRQNEADPLKRDERLEQATRSMGAFIAITGKAKLRSIPGPVPGVPPTDVTLPGMIEPTPRYDGYGSGPSTDWRAETKFIY